MEILILFDNLREMGQPEEFQHKQEDLMMMMSCFPFVFAQQFYHYNFKKKKMVPTLPSFPPRSRTNGCNCLELLSFRKFPKASETHFINPNNCPSCNRLAGRSSNSQGFRKGKGGVVFIEELDPIPFLNQIEVQGMLRIMIVPFNQVPY